MRAPNQLPLRIRLGEAASFESFVPADDGLATAHLRALATGRQEPLTFVWGGPATGKTHLLQATARAAQQHFGSACYLPLREIAGEHRAALDGTDGFAVVCVDDVDALHGDRAGEQALFGLIERLREAGRSLVVSGRRPPGRVPFDLPDLVSRLQWGPCFELPPLDDDGKLAAMRRRARAHGFRLSEAAGRYLLTRTGRDLAHLLQLVERIDEATLSEQRRVTLPFLRKFLASLPTGATRPAPRRND